MHAQFGLPAADFMDELTAKRTDHYPVEISDTWCHFGRNRILKNGRISGQPEPDIRYIPNCNA